jgi:hypothetical protein
MFCVFVCVCIGGNDENRMYSRRIKTTDKKEPPSTEALSAATILNDKSLNIIRRVLLNTDFMENMK